MRDDFTGRFWAENHQLWSASILRGIDKLSYAFYRLSAHQFDAPWRRPEPKTSERCA